MLKALSTFLLPLSILSIAGLFLPWADTLTDGDQETLALLPYVLSAAGLLVGFHFRRGRMVLAFLLLALFYFIFRTFLFAGLTTAESSLWYRASVLVLPANLLLLSIMREKGILSSAGRLRLAVLAGELFAVWFSIRYRYAQIWEGLTEPLLYVPHTTWLTLPQGGVILLAASAAVSGIKVVVRNSPIDGGLFGGSIALFVVLNWMWVPHVALVFCSAAALILIASLLHDSHNMAFRDELTGLPSRRALKEELLGMGRRYALAMVDVDHFKRFNDTYGHDVGDQVLKMVAAKMERVAGGGRAYRYGGEEFIVIFANKGERDVLPHLEELRRTIAEYRMVLRDEPRPKDDEVGKNRRSNRQGERTVGVTVSIGVAASSEGSSGAEDVIKAADQCLYRAKGKGRNQICS